MRTRYKKQKNTVFLTALAVLLGVAIMTAANTNKVEELRDDQNTQELIAYIKQLEEDTNQLEERITSTRAQIDEISSEQTSGKELLTGLNDKLVTLSQYACRTEMTGQGLIITLNDNAVAAEMAQKNNPATYNAENYIVHDKDILYLIRSLAEYTEAISINNIRLIDATSIRCTGTVILVGSTRLSPPYEISIIGDAKNLEKALDNSSRYHRLLYTNIPVTVTVSNNITVPAYSGAYAVTHGTLLSQQIDDDEE